MTDSSVKILTSDDLKELERIYEKHIPYASHVHSLLLTYFKWKKSHPDRNYLTFYAKNDDWRNSGTFLVKHRSFDIFVFTLDKSGEDLYSLLHQSKLLKMEPRTWLTVLYGTRNEHLPPVYKSLEDLDIPIKVTVQNKIYWLPKEEALKFSIDCPEDVYIGRLDLSHVGLICSLWPHAFAGAEEYLSSYIEMNGGYGVFLRKDGRLISWIMQNLWGTLTVLETDPEYKRKGYGSLITQKMCIEVAKEGINPLCTIVVGNDVSEALFAKLGFKHIGDCTFVIY